LWVTDNHVRLAVIVAVVIVEQARLGFALDIIRLLLHRP
jgi:hypothetical protein